MPVLRQSVGFVISLLTVTGGPTSGGSVERLWANGMPAVVFPVTVGASIGSTALFMAGYCFYVRKKPERIQLTCCKKEVWITALKCKEATHKRNFKYIHLVETDR